MDAVGHEVLAHHRLRAIAGEDPEVQQFVNCSVGMPAVLANVLQTKHGWSEADAVTAVQQMLYTAAAQLAE